MAARMRWVLAPFDSISRYLCMTCGPDYHYAYYGTSTIKSYYCNYYYNCG